MSEWVRAPWSYEVHELSTGYSAIAYDARGHRIGGLDHLDEPTARLIAAAPEMYEALTEAALQIEYLHDKFQSTGSGEATLARIRAALAKAGGGNG